MSAKYRFSASRLSTWMTCPLQAKFQYEDKLPRRQSAAASFGVCIHHALEHYNKTGNLDSSLLLFIDNWENPEKLGVEPDEWPKGTSYGSYRQRGLEVLRSYHDKMRWAHREVIATEHQFLVPFGDFELYGFVDLVEMRKNSRGKDELRVIDYKTNKRQPNLTALKLNIQFTVYAYAASQSEFWFGSDETPPIENAELLWERTNGLKPKAVWYHLETSKDINAGVRDDNDFMRLYRACTEIYRAMRNEVYVPDISGDACTLCPYTVECGIPVISANGDDDEE